MDTGIPFDFSFITFDKRKKRGGEFITIRGAVKAGMLSKREEQMIIDNQPSSAVSTKKPNHFKNSTRNVILPNKEIRKVHLRLIRVFNNKIVI